MNNENEQVLPQDDNANLPSDEEETEISSQEQTQTEKVAEETEEAEAIGLITMLNYIGEDLLYIYENETDPEEKNNVYLEIDAVLSDIHSEITAMLEELTFQELPEKVAELTRDIDQAFIEASNLFLESIDYYRKFLEKEDPVLIEEARNIIQEGANQLEKADAKAQALENIPEEPGTSFEV